MQYLDRDRAIELRIPGRVHGSHAAAAHELDDLVAPDHIARAEMPDLARRAVPIADGLVQRGARL